MRVLPNSFREQLTKKLEAFGMDPNFVSLIDELISLQQGLTKKEYELLALFVIGFLIKQEEGNTRVSLIEDDWVDILKPLTVDAQQIASDITALLNSAKVDHLVGETSSSRPFLKEDNEISSHYFWHLEKNFVQQLLKFTQKQFDAINNIKIEEATQEIKELPLNHLNSDQMQALDKVFRQSLTLITGGPGTGKTSIIFSLLQCFAHFGFNLDRVALGAPTGKAAYRIKELLTKQTPTLEFLPEPQTLHRLLKHQPNRSSFYYHEDNPLPYDLVIIDEMSMVSLDLMAGLIKSLSSQTRLVLLGDVDQIPPVEMGSVFADLINNSHGALAQNIVELKQSYRMNVSDPDGSRIYTFSQSLKKGSINENNEFIEITSKNQINQIKHKNLEHIDASHLKEFLDSWLERWNNLIPQECFSKDFSFLHSQPEEKEKLIIQKAFEALDQARLLAVTQVLPTGTQNLNRLLHLNQIKKQSNLGLSDTSVFIPGEPIMMLTNDYNRQLYNGDQGILLNTSDQGLCAVFDRQESYALFPVDSLKGKIEHAYALTIHKSQGSEFEDISLILPTQWLPLLSCELLYTAITRARKGVLIVGDLDVLKQGIDHQVRRRTGIGNHFNQEFLAKSHQSGP